MKDAVVPFVIAFAVCAAVFLGIDYAVMKMMGLALIYQG